MTALSNHRVEIPGLGGPTWRQVQSIRADITDRNSLECLRKAGVVFHLAAMASPKACHQDFLRAYTVNVDGTKNVLEACNADTRFIFISGAILYGDPLYLPIDENHPIRARDPYSLTKSMGESLCWGISQWRRLRPTVVRNFTTYGPGQTADYVVPSLISQGLSQRRLEVWSCRPSRDFTYIDDTVNGLLKIASCEAAVGHAVNLCSGNETTIGEVASTIAGILGSVPITDLKKDVLGSLRQCGKNQKLKQLTEWIPKVGLHDGLQRTIATIQDRPFTS